MKEKLARYQARIEQVLDRCLTLPDSGTARLREGMRYSVLGGGKRLRPILVYTTGEALGAPLEHLDVPAGGRRARARLQPRARRPARDG